MSESTTLDSTQLEKHRSALTGHCYRMLGSPEEADDAVQETLVRAWRNLDRFEQRSSVKTWLYSIATRVCLDALADRARRVRPMELGPVGTVRDELRTRPAAEFIEPIPESEVLPEDSNPAERAILRQSIRLAFMAALQHLPPRQRAALLLMEVLGCSAAEVAATLDMSVPAVNSAIQRARATLETRQLQEDAIAAQTDDPDLVHRYVEAFERYDMDALTRLLHRTSSCPCRRTPSGCVGPRRSVTGCSGEKSTAGARGCCPPPPTRRLPSASTGTAGPGRAFRPGGWSCWRSPRVG
jgi:RNA polymerase sigma-70 factor (ECF subfamily)